MKSRTTLSVAVAVLSLVAPVATGLAQDAKGQDKWDSVAMTDSQEAFVNTSSIAVVGAQLEAKVKQNFAEAQPSAKKNKSYLSSRTTFRFDCTGRRMAMKEVRTYAGSDLQGDAVQKATSGDKNLQWLDAGESTVYGEVLDYVCGHSPGG